MAESGWRRAGRILLPSAVVPPFDPGEKLPLRALQLWVHACGNPVFAIAAGAAAILTQDATVIAFAVFVGIYGCAYLVALVVGLVKQRNEARKAWHEKEQQRASTHEQMITLTQRSELLTVTRLHGDSIPFQLAGDPTTPTLNDVRNKLSEWARLGSMQLRAAGKEELAREFALSDDEALDTAEDLQAAYDKRAALLNPWPI